MSTLNEGAYIERNPKLSETVARRIVQSILDGDRTEGAPLPNERAMIESFGVARPTLREALRLLESLGIIVVKNGRGGGPVVRKPRPVDVGRLLSLVLAFEGMSVEDVLQARIEVEPILVRLAAERITDEELHRLSSLVDQMASHLNDNERFSAANAQFHAEIIASSNQVVLGIVESSLRTICPRLSSEYSLEQRNISVEWHRTILHFLEAHDALGAETAVRDHLTQAIEYWQIHDSLSDQMIEWIP